MTDTPYGGITSIKSRGSELGNRFSPTGVEELTRSGEMISLLAPRIEQIHMKDIAAHLAAQVRFNGACPLLPTIAQHSLAVEYIAGCLFAQTPSCTAAPWSLRRAALMHDAAEYLVGDTVAAIKKLMRPEYPVVNRPPFNASAFDAIEERIQFAIVDRFNCSDKGWEDIIHEADCIACAYEMAWEDWCIEARPPAWLLDCRGTTSFALNGIYEAPYGRSSMYDGGEEAFVERARQLGMVDDV